MDRLQSRIIEPIPRQTGTCRLICNSKKKHKYFPFKLGAAAKIKESVRYLLASAVSTTTVGPAGSEAVANKWQCSASKMSARTLGNRWEWKK
jgi:hypothetical protein